MISSLRITSAKPLFSNKLTFTGTKKLGLEYMFCGNTIQPITMSLLVAETTPICSPLSPAT